MLLNASTPAAAAPAPASAASTPSSSGAPAAAGGERPPAPAGAAGAPAPGAAPKPEAPARLSPQLEAFAKESARLRAERAAFQAERDAWEKSRASAPAPFKPSKEDLMADPDGYLAQHFGLSEDDRVGAAEHMFYARMPDKAPPHLQAKLTMRAERAKMERDWAAREQAAAAREAEAAAKAAEADQARATATVRAYAAQVRGYYDTAAAKLPASRAFWAENHDAYIQTVLATANNLASSYDPASGAAPPDLSFSAVADHVEAEMAKRFARFQPSAPAPAAAPAAAPAPFRQPLAGTLARNDNPGMAAPTRALTEEERIARATAFTLFKQK